MAAELEKLRQDVRDLANHFKKAGQDDLAALLAIDAQSLGAKAQIASARGLITFAQVDSHKIADQTPARLREEMFVPLGLTPEQVARHPNQITKDTKAYVGSIIRHDNSRRIIPISDRLQGIEIYTSPDRKIRRQSLEIDGRLARESIGQVMGEYKQVGVNVSEYGKDILKGVKFTGNPRVIELIWLTGYDLGFEGVTTTRDILERGKALGFEKCDGEVGPYLRFADKDQPMNTWYSIAMDPIADRGGCPSVFKLARRGVGLWLDNSWAKPDYRWYPVAQFVFSLPQGNLKT